MSWLTALCIARFWEHTKRTPKHRFARVLLFPRTHRDSIVLTVFNDYVTAISFHIWAVILCLIAHMLYIIIERFSHIFFSLPRRTHKDTCVSQNCILPPAARPLSISPTALYALLLAHSFAIFRTRATNATIVLPSFLCTAGGDNCADAAVGVAAAASLLHLIYTVEWLMRSSGSCRLST